MTPRLTKDEAVNWRTRSHNQIDPIVDDEVEITSVSRYETGMSLISSKDDSNSDSDFYREDFVTKFGEADLKPYPRC